MICMGSLVLNSPAEWITNFRASDFDFYRDTHTLMWLKNENVLVFCE